MEDDKIKDLFDSFNPGLSATPRQFMDRLQKNMEAVELIRQHSAALHRRNRLAVALAAVSGFAVGVLLTLLFPLVSPWVSTLSISLPHIHISGITVDYTFVPWIIMAGVSVLTALSVYDLAMTRLTPSPSYMEK